MSDLKLDEFAPTPDPGGSRMERGTRSAADPAAVYDVPVKIQAVLGART